MKKTMVITMVLALLASASWAQQGPRAMRGDCPMPQRPRQECMGPHHGGQNQFGPREGMGRLLMFADEIGLSNDQQEKIKTLSLEHKMEMVDLQVNVKKSALQLKALISNDAAKNDVLQAIERASQSKMEIAKAKYLHRQAMKDILTSEQQDKLKKLRMDRRGERFEGKSGGRQSFRDHRFGR